MEKKKVLLVIDMQNDFVTGALANPQAEEIIPAIAAKIRDYRQADLPVYFTRDTHGSNYMETQEGRLLPVPHCIKETDGWQIVPELAAFSAEEDVLDKPSFGCMDLPKWLNDKIGGEPAEIQLCGVCTDICVISNAIILKAAFPEAEVTVDGALCAGVTPESHDNALAAMGACQVIIK